MWWMVNGERPRDEYHLSPYLSIVQGRTVKGHGRAGWECDGGPDRVPGHVLQEKETCVRDHVSTVVVTLTMSLARLLMSQRSTSPLYDVTLAAHKQWSPNSTEVIDRTTSGKFCYTIQT